MQRVTPERGPEPPELLVFTVEEAALGVKAVSYYVTTSLQTLETNWNNEGYHAFAQDTADDTEAIDRVARFVSSHQKLAQKLHGAMVSPDEAVEFERDDISGLGNALFRLGNGGLPHAVDALRQGTIGSSDVGRDEVAILETATNTYNLFKQLEPIAQANVIEWFVWEQPPVLANVDA